jgi:hypothetical protein
MSKVEFSGTIEPGDSYEKYLKAPFSTKYSLRIKERMKK